MPLVSIVIAIEDDHLYSASFNKLLGGVSYLETQKPGQIEESAKAGEIERTRNRPTRSYSVTEAK